MKLATVILAAGKGKRMKSWNKSKVMCELLGILLIESVVALAFFDKESNTKNKNYYYHCDRFFTYTF